MRDIFVDLDHWLKDGASIAVAIVVQTWGSSPRRAGARMILTSDGQISGSVSGGCVENAVFEAGIESLKTNHPQLLHFGVADETAWEVGLACGGSIDIFVKPLNKNLFHDLGTLIQSEAQALLVTVIRGPEKVLGRELLIFEDGHIKGSLGNDLEKRVLELAKETRSQKEPQRFQLNQDIEVFLEPVLPAPTLIIVGGVHIAIALASLAKTVGYRVVLIDPRKAWGNAERFPNVDQLIRAWPEAAFGQVQITRNTAVAMLTHDPKLDDPAAKIALSSPAFYVGALGSKSTHAKRRERLLMDGMTETQLSHLHAPIGLDLGAQSPEEIALAIMAEITSAYRKQERQTVRNEADLHPITG